MARRIHYKIEDDGVNQISDDEWEQIVNLQRWYNSEFFWSAGRIALKMFSIFPNWEKTKIPKEKLWETINNKRNELISAGVKTIQIIRELESQGLIIVQKGGYKEKCIASGFTRVANNEFNAYLVCEFLLKISLIVKNIIIDIYDEGKFIKCQRVWLSNGIVLIPKEWIEKNHLIDEYVINRKIFSKVNPAKYDNFPNFKTHIKGYKDLEKKDRLNVLHDWKWLGFDDNYDMNGDDREGYDLNRKVMGFMILDKIH